MIWPERNDKGFDIRSNGDKDDVRLQMKTQSRPVKDRKPEWDDAEAVEAFLGKLEGSVKAAVQKVRSIILGADRRITEGIKWNSPSFYCNGWFATLNMHRKGMLLVVLHQGAKVKDNSTVGMRISDDTKLLEWVAKERCLVKFYGLDDIKAKENAFKAVIKQWVKEMLKR